jgi:uncharacterized protein with von Willebrand factor type A (vWA) domain
VKKRRCGDKKNWKGSDRMGYFGEESFMRQFMKQSQGRVFYPHPTQMGKMVLVDFLQNKKAIFQY